MKTNMAVHIAYVISTLCMAARHGLHMPGRRVGSYNAEDLALKTGKEGRKEGRNIFI